MYDANSGDSRQIVNQLNKMLKDFKNTDYYDQIYYALAEIEIKEGNAKRAEDFLLKSIKASTTNKQQKGISSLKLADWYFEIPKYPMAGAYYDSAVTFLDEKFEGYDVVLNKKKSLDRLIFDYNTIATEDSLQRMAKLSDKDLDKLVTSMIQKAKDDEERKKAEAEEQALNGAAAAPGGASNQKDQGSGSSWYFYNQQQITFGFSEFQKKWGARKLEDNWRRSNKQIIASFVPDTDSDSLSGKKAIAAVDTTGPTNSKQWYLKNLPVGKEKMDASVLKVVEAYYDLGIIYKEQLLNLEKAAASFENLNAKIPGNKYEATCYYQLYRLYLSMKDMAMAEKYKNIILTKFPDSDYAAILKNPQFNLERKNRMNKIESFYEETYTAYTNGNYAIALERCNAADTLIAQSPFKPKFSLLKALTIGHLKPLADFELSLKQVVADYPKDSVKIRAEEILIVIQKLKFGDTPALASDTLGAKKSNYKVGPDKSHLFVLAFETKDVNTQQITAAVADFNVEYYETKEYQTNYIPFGSSKGLVVVKPIKNGTEAIDYFGTIQSADNIFSTLPAGKYTYFIISDENYIALFKEQNTDGYLAFFMQNYKMEKE
jgi:tetratricopeptide (TPR) repeat protein